MIYKNLHIENSEKTFDIKVNNGVIVAIDKLITPEKGE